jgi:phosphinothricin acetyltransferase
MSTPRHIRLATADDAPAVLAIYAPVVEQTVISFEYQPPSPEELAGRIETTVVHYPWLVCADEAGAVGGYAYASQHRARAAYQWGADVSVYVAAGWRRRGVGAALYQALLGLLARQGFYTAFAGITLPNPASVGLHEAAGFRPLGVYRQVGYKLGRWHDVGWWQCDLRPRAEEPAPTLPIGALVGTAAWSEVVGAAEQRLAG